MTVHPPQPSQQGSYCTSSRTCYLVASSFPPPGDVPFPFFIFDHMFLGFVEGRCSGEVRTQTLCWVCPLPYPPKARLGSLRLRILRVIQGQVFRRQLDIWVRAQHSGPGCGQMLSTVDMLANILGKVQMSIWMCLGCIPLPMCA